MLLTKDSRHSFLPNIEIPYTICQVNGVITILSSEFTIELSCPKRIEIILSIRESSINESILDDILTGLICFCKEHSINRIRLPYLQSNQYINILNKHCFQPDKLHSYKLNSIVIEEYILIC